LTQLTGHRLDFAHRQVQLGCNLFIGKVQAHEVQAQDPDFQGQVMAFKNGTSQVIELLTARFTQVALPVSLMSVKTSLVNQLGIAIRAFHPVWPAHLAHFFVAALFINQMVNMEKHALILPACFSTRHLLETD
jgi:hypothetical protein